MCISVVFSKCKESDSLGRGYCSVSGVHAALDSQELVKADRTLRFPESASRKDVLKARLISSASRAFVYIKCFLEREKALEQLKGLEKGKTVTILMNIPEGFSFPPKGERLASQLLKAVGEGDYFESIKILRDSDEYLNKCLLGGSLNIDELSRRLIPDYMRINAVFSVLKKESIERVDKSKFIVTLLGKDRHVAEKVRGAAIRVISEVVKDKVDRDIFKSVKEKVYTDVSNVLKDEKARQKVMLAIFLGIQYKGAKDDVDQEISSVIKDRKVVDKVMREISEAVKNKESKIEAEALNWTKILLETGKISEEDRNLAITEAAFGYHWSVVRELRGTGLFSGPTLLLPKFYYAGHAFADCIRKLPSFGRDKLAFLRDRFVSLGHHLSLGGGAFYERAVLWCRNADICRSVFTSYGFGLVPTFV